LDYFLYLFALAKISLEKFLEQEPASTDEILRKALSLTQYREIASYLLEKDTSEEEAVWNAAYVLEFCNSRKLKEKAWHYLKCHPKKEVLLFWFTKRDCLCIPNI